MCLEFCYFALYKHAAKTRVERFFIEVILPPSLDYVSSASAITTSVVCWCLIIIIIIIMSLVTGLFFLVILLNQQ